MRISNYRATNNEANFGKPISTQVTGGTHVTFEMITYADEYFYVTHWPKGLPGHDDPPDTLRFPHGLMRFGESLDDCAARLVQAQLGMKVNKAAVAYWDSYVDDHNHWHIEPGCFVEVFGKPVAPSGASEILRFTSDDIPKLTFWDRSEFGDVVKPLSTGK